jgi:EAL domain-containing protein (putative c-di-GMP-specific phosphodiesterase class I)
MSTDRYIEFEALQGLLNNEVFLHYQPIINAVRNEVVMFEALMRWKHPKLGLMCPAPIYQQAQPESMCELAMSWLLTQGISQSVPGHIWNRSQKLSINLWAENFASPNLIPLLQSMVTSLEIHPSQLVLELTETQPIKRVRDVAEHIKALKAMGFLVALDDFGRGYSNIDALCELPFDALKLDRAFVAQIGHDRKRDIVISRLVQLAYDLDIDVVAEGVETPLQRDFLLSLGCEHHQGFFYGMAEPLPMTPPPTGMRQSYIEKSVIS